MGYKVKRIYQGTNLVRPVWKPGANTLAYRPLTSNLNDYSGNNHNFSATSGTYSFSNNMCTLQRATISGWSMSGYSGDFTVLAYATSAGSGCYVQLQISNSGYPSIRLGRSGDIIRFDFVNSTNTQWIGVGGITYIGTGVHLLTGVKTSTYTALYLDGVEQGKITGSYGNMYSSTEKNLRLGRGVNGSGTATFGNIIIESKERTQQEIQDYYNNTKSNYGL